MVENFQLKVLFNFDYQFQIVTEILSLNFFHTIVQPQKSVGLAWLASSYLYKNPNNWKQRPVHE